MVIKKVRRALGYARTAYGIYRTARRYLKRRRRTYSTRRSMLPSVGVKAVSSKRYGAKMNKLYHCGRVQNLMVSLPASRNVKSPNNQYYHAQLPSASMALPLQMYLPLEMFYLKRYYQSFKIHRFKVTATVASVTGIPTSVSNPVARIAIGADYLYRRKFWTTDNDSQNTNSQLVRAVLDYSDMMELPNVKTRDLLLSNLNNGSTVSCYVSPGRGCINPNISTDKVETGTRPALQDFDTEHGNISNQAISKASNQLYVA